MTNYEAGLAAGRADGVQALRKMSQKLAEITADRDEWKQQHENLLAMYQAQTAELAALKQPRMETKVGCSTCNDTGSVQDTEVPYLGNPCPDCK